MLWEYVDLTEWTTKEELLNVLNRRGIFIKERTWRLEVERQNELYQNHESETFIAHSNKGYKIATSEEEIRNSARDYRARAMDQLVKCSKILKALGENGNMKIEIENGKFLIGGEL
jgi:hypothetical protein